jgi:hypothetical protein
MNKTITASAVMAKKNRLTRLKRHISKLADMDGDSRVHTIAAESYTSEDKMLVNDGARFSLAQRKEKTARRVVCTVPS